MLYLTYKCNEDFLFNIFLRIILLLGLFSQGANMKYYKTRSHSKKDLQEISKTKFNPNSMTDLSGLSPSLNLLK